MSWRVEIHDDEARYAPAPQIWLCGDCATTSDVLDDLDVRPDELSSQDLADELWDVDGEASPNRINCGHCGDILGELIYRR